MIAPVIHWYFKQRSKELQDNLQLSLIKQDELFQELLFNLSKTNYGEAYSIDGSETYAQFAAKLPVVQYEDIQPWIERNLQGEQGLLWPGDITWFAKSSGTTNSVSKYIPISYESMEYNHYTGNREVLTQFTTLFPNSNIFEGKGLLIGGSQSISGMSSDTFTGDLSAILMNHAPSWVNWKSTPDIEISTMPDWEKKVEAMAQATINENVTSISGVPTWALVLFKRILEITGKSNIHEVWPNMELFIHGGVSFLPYREQFQELLPKSHMKYLETYNASEGFFAVQASVDSTDLVLLTHIGIFYEFYPVNEGPEKTIPLADVKVGVNYVVVISTVGGLWRYVIGDTIQFTSVKPFLFIITGRMKLFINSFGEELVIENAEKAIAFASRETNAVVNDYTAGPVFMSQENPGHQWLVEFSTQPNDIKQFALLLDDKLKEINSDYAAKRHADMVMKFPKVEAVPNGTFEAWLKSKGKLGGQNKVPRLANDRRILDEILGMIH
ncbi:MAG: GH3 auxin-responsive promoter family protein [Bacteroidota bacterium]|jgi:hypothetical protein